MKKLLYGSTALVAAGAMAVTPAAAEEGVKLGLGGYYNTFFWIGDQDEADADPRNLGATGLFNEGEVHFKGSTTLDNGITFGAQLELEIGRPPRHRRTVAAKAAHRDRSRRQPANPGGAAR